MRSPRHVITGTNIITSKLSNIVVNHELWITNCVAVEAVPEGTGGHLASGRLISALDCTRMITEQTGISYVRSLRKVRRGNADQRQASAPSRSGFLSPIVREPVQHNKL